VFFPLEASDGGYVRADTNGYQILLNYQGTTGHFETVSLMDILNERVPMSWGRDRIILIGPVSESFKDFYPTPYSSDQFNFPEQMPGVEIQAHLISQIIQAALGESPLIQTLSEPFEWIWIVLWAGVGSSITWTKRYYQDQLTLILQLSSMIAAGFILMGITYAAFLQGYWIPIVPPLLGLAGSALAITGHMAHKASLTRATFGRYLTDEVVAQLLESRDGFKWGGNRQQLTILASDLRGFTALSERLKPEEVVQIINIYFRQMSKVIICYGGTINKLMGDGMLILFNSALSQENDAQQGIACAIAMQLEMQNVNQILNELGFPNLEMGIGLNTGEAVVGNIGSEEHTEYTAIGCEVNLAFRIEACTTGGEILMSETTKNAAAPALLKLQPVKRIKVKGFQATKKIYKVLGIGSPYHLFLPNDTEILLPLNYQFPIQYSVLQGKQESDLLYIGYLVKLSQNEAEIQLTPEDVNELPELHTNVKINFRQFHHQGVEKSYAKVICLSQSQQSFQIRFTYRPPSVVAQLQAMYESLQVLNSVESFPR
jgi:adenylate cyclase